VILDGVPTNTLALLALVADQKHRYRLYQVHIRISILQGPFTTILHPSEKKRMTSEEREREQVSIAARCVDAHRLEIL
jgi:hypothetical protein